MKKTIIILATLLLPMLQGCSGFLDKDPRTSLSDETVYGDEVSLESAISGCYSALYHSSLWFGGFQEYLNLESGLNIWKGGKKTVAYICNRYFTRYSNVTGNSDVFGALYAAIYRCNSLIDKIVYSKADEQFNTEIVAEAHLIRALCYFTLVRIYGDVPIIISLPDSYLETNRPRDPYYKVYAQIIKDLDFAEENMRDYDRQEELTYGKGRPCKTAATALKSAVYLQIGSLLSDVNYQFFDLEKEGRAPDFKALGIEQEKDAWKLAYDTAQAVIDSGVYSLAPSYAKLFSWDSEDCHHLRERIFMLQMTTECKHSSTCYAVARSMPNFIEGVDNNNYGRFRPSRFVYQKWATTYGPKYNESRSDGYYDIAEGCQDPRMDWTYFHGTYLKPNGSTSTVYPLVKSSTTSSGTYLPYFRKYYSPDYTLNHIGTADLYIMRYAEIFLIKAEAAASLSEGPGDKWWADAFNAVEVLHQRARNTVTPPAAQPTWQDDDHVIETKDELIEAIFWERVFEMNGENHEYFDSHRRGARFLSKYIAIPLNEFLNQPSEFEYKKTTYAISEEEETFYRIYVEDPKELRKSVINEYPETEIRYNTSLTFSNANDFTWGL